MSKRNLVALLIAALLLSACSAKAPVPTPQALTGISKSSGVAPDIAQPQAPADSSIYRESASGDVSNAAGSGGAAADRLVIKNANLTLVVVDPLKSMDAITRLATEMKGFVVSSNSYKTTSSDGTEYPEASITIRVPAERLDEALQTIKKQVQDTGKDVLSENITGQDVTKEYTDLKSREKNLEDAEAQLREIMASATKPEDVLNIFNQLTQIREQIEVLKGQIQYYEESAALSAISVQLKAEASVQPLTIGRWQPAGVARDAIQALLNGLKLIANAGIWLVLFALPIAIVIYIPLRLIWMLLRRLRNNRRGPRPAAPPAAPAAPASGGE